MPVGLISVNFARRRSLLGLAGLAGSKLSKAAGQPRRVLRALVQSWRPYLDPQNDGTMRGLDAELLQAICQQAGYELEWVQAPPEWRRRRFRELLTGKFDVVFSATPVAANAPDVMYTVAYRNEAMMVAAPVSHAHALDGLRSFEDLITRKIRLLHIDSIGLGKDFESYRQRLEAARLLVPYQTTQQGMKMLLVGRAPLIIGDALDLQAQARALGTSLARQPYGASVLPVSLMLGRKALNDQDLARIDQAIQVLEQRGVLGAIRRRYDLP